MEIIRAVLSNNLYDGTSTACVLRRIGADFDLNLFDGFSVWGNHRRAAPALAVCAYAVELIGVCFNAGAVRAHLNRVLHLENAAARSTRATVTREIVGATIRVARPGTKNTRCQAQKLEGIATELRQVFDLLLGDISGERGIFGIQRRQRVTRHGDLLRYGPWFKCEVDAADFLGVDLHVLDHLFLEAAQRSIDGIQPRRKVGYAVETLIIRNGFLGRGCLLVRPGEPRGRRRPI